jgi:hypothetical protein
LQLSDEALEAIIDILMTCGLLGYMPPVIGYIVILLLTKPTGGRKPIGLLPSFYTLRCKIRLPLVQDWERRWARPYFASAP